MVVVGREGKWCVVKNAFGAEGNVPVSYVKVEVDMQASDVTDLGLAETSAIQGDLAVKMSQISMSPTQTPSPSSFNTFRGTPTRGAASPVNCLSPSSSGAVSAIVPPLTKKEMKAAAKAVKAAEKKEKKDKKSKKRISQLSSKGANKEHTDAMRIVTEFERKMVKENAIRAAVVVEEDRRAADEAEQRAADEAAAAAEALQAKFGMGSAGKWLSTEI